MKLELKNIKYFASGSQETYCYTATLYVNGKRTAEISNSGHGGCDEVRSVTEDIATTGRLDLAEAHCKAMPKTEYHGTMLGHTLESVCHNLVTDHLAVKDLKRVLRRKFLFQTAEGSVIETPRRKGDTNESIIADITKQSPGAKLLNAMGFDDALAIYRTI